VVSFEISAQRSGLRIRLFDEGCRFRYDALAGWSSLVARRAHNPKVVGSNPTPATMGSFRRQRTGPFQFSSKKDKNKCPRRFQA
jgi:hypothetical protein